MTRPEEPEIVAVRYQAGAHHYSSDDRNVQIVHRVKDSFGFERDRVVAKVWSARGGGDAFSEPTLDLVEDNQGMRPRFTRAQWETFKREGDAAFDAFETAWPPSAAPEGDRLVCNCPRESSSRAELVDGVAVDVWHRVGCPRYGLTP
jgi:hypothetical protein